MGGWGSRCWGRSPAGPLPYTRPDMTWDEFYGVSGPVARDYLRAENAKRAATKSWFRGSPALPPSKPWGEQAEEVHCANTEHLWQEVLAEQAAKKEEERMHASRRRLILAQPASAGPTST